ncbi:MAG: M1 family peptidase, partial [Bacteroidetes bacterium]
MHNSKFLPFLVCSLLSFTVQSQSNHGTKFEQLGTILPASNTYRGIDGAPGPDYWQQQVDYQIKCELDVKKIQLRGHEKITYHNNSPSTLRYLWLQLDENQHSVLNDNQYFTESKISDKMSESAIRGLDSWREKEKYGVHIELVKDQNGNDLKYTINQTMMRVELPSPVKSGENFTFSITWNYYLVDRIDMQHIATGDASTLARGGYEYFPDDGNYLFTMTQWYPRLCAYTDAVGWQNNQFTGRGEFALTFGNFDVEITVPDDHVIGSTGECQNYPDVLSEEALNRWNEAQTSDEPVEIVTLENAQDNEQKKVSKVKQVWKYKAENVRDFAWTASKKFIWDALAYENTDGKKVMCMSYYPKEAYPIYRRYSSKAVRHTLDVYSRYSIPYPYPVAISVEAASGMEYPMICFNPGRAEEDGTYSEASKNSAISVIIHEVGHNYYP